MSSKMMIFLKSCKKW